MSLVIAQPAEKPLVAALGHITEQVHAPFIVVSVIRAEHHAVVNSHCAVFTKQLHGSFQETVAGITRVTIDWQNVVGRVWLDSELTILGVDLKERIYIKNTHTDGCHNISWLSGRYWAFYYLMFEDQMVHQVIQNLLILKNQVRNRVLAEKHNGTRTGLNWIEHW